MSKKTIDIYQCDYCDEEFTSEEVLTKHLEKHDTVFVSLEKHEYAALNRILAQARLVGIQVPERLFDKFSSMRGIR